jgi:hypothetical protein
MVALTMMLLLIALQLCAVRSYKPSSMRMKVTMASSNPFSSFLGGLNKPSSSSAGERSQPTSFYSAADILFASCSDSLKAFESAWISIQ